MARNYGRLRCAGEIDPKEMEPLTRRAGRWFAHLNMTDPDLLPYQLLKAQRLLVDGKPAEALTYAGFAQLAAPVDPRVTHIIAMANLRGGRMRTARRAFTAALTQGSQSAETYLGRALTAASMGDVQRMEKDLKSARSLDEALTEDWKDAINKTLGAAKPAVQGVALNKLRLRAKNDRSINELESAALEIHRAAAPLRLRYDERYQERVHELTEAAGHSPSDPQVWIALAKYIGQEADLRGESVEPRRAMVPYRWQGSRKAELERALDYAERAIAVAPKYVRAIMIRADILAALGRDKEAEDAAQQALDIDPQDTEAMTLYALYKGRRAIALNSQAAALRADHCSSSSSVEHRSDGVYRVTRRTCYPPAPSDLARAARLDAQAQKLRQRSRDTMQRAMQLTRGSYMGYLLQADVCLWQRDDKGAVAALRKAVALDTKDLRAHESLVRLLPRIGEFEAAAEHQILINSTLQTTAAPLLRLARSAIEQQSWEAAQRLLIRAQGLDVEDARVPAYLGVVFEGAGRQAEAVAAFRQAIAMERARIALDHGTGLKREILDFGLLIALIQRVAAQTAAGRGRLEAAVELYDQAIALLVEFAPNWRPQQMFTAILPPDKSEPLNGASIIAQAYLQHGKLEKALGRRAQAMTSFQRAVALGPDVDKPNIAAASGDSNFAGDAGIPAGDAVVELGKLYLEDGRADDAQSIFARLGYMNLSDEARREANSLSGQLVKLQNRQQAHREQQNLLADDAYLSSQRQLREELQRARAQPRLSGNAYEGRSGFAATLRIDPALVGTWSFVPQAQWQLVGGSGTYRFSDDGRYSFTTPDGRTVRRGSWGVPGRWGGALILLGEDGTTETVYPESVDADHYVVTASDAVKYDLRRLR